ncbi:putative diacyglycerol O-acyltransferase MT3172 [Acropora millepora]|uniref:putative diacyglycerol O-acyltransferase MT3172 n=1 Tax=Acropora millepora TaxID=45264 RepID=UPI001CF357C9|nr:putative diacyglycerol O-acyltransferase MT3172 [Acropora millepora]
MKDFNCSHHNREPITCELLPVAKKHGLNGNSPVSFKGEKLFLWEDIYVIKSLGLTEVTFYQRTILPKFFHIACKMNVDCINPPSVSTETALGVCGDFLPSLVTLANQEKRSTVIDQEFTAFVEPIHKRFSGARLLLAVMANSIMYQLKCTVAFFAFCLVIPFLMIVLVVLKLVKFSMERYVSYTRQCVSFREDDAVWQQDCPANRHIIHALMVLEGPADIQKLRQLVNDRLVFGRDDKGHRVCARLTQVVQKHFGYFVWKEDENFSVENHVLIWGGDLPKSLEELDMTLSEICSTSLPDLLSPWQFVVVPILEVESFGLLLRVHHSIADGVALARVFVKNLFDASLQIPEPQKFSTKQRVYMWCKAIFVGPSIVLTKLFSRADSSKIHGQELNGKKFVAWSKNIELSLVKQVKNIAGTTVNDVMVSCLAGALHDYLRKKEDCDAAQEKDIWASVPVDIRASTKSLKLKNKFALVFLRLPIEAKNAVDRLLATKQRMDAIKTSAEPLVTAATVQTLMMFPEWVSRPLIDFFCRKMSCVLSNVPGPQQILSLGGQKIVQGIFWVPQRANIGVGLSIFSYGGGIRVGVYSDESVISNPREVVKSFETNFCELVKELNISKSLED